MYLKALFLTTKTRFCQAGLASIENNASMAL